MEYSPSPLLNSITNRRVAGITKRNTNKDMNEIAVCAVSFGEKYNWRMGRLKETLENTNPGVKFFSWVDRMPDGARPFNESMYGFKPWAIKIARDYGYKKIFWIDCTAVVQDKLDYYFQFSEEYGGVLAVQDDNKLGGFCANKALGWIGEPRAWLKDKHLVGGSLYYFDFNQAKCQKIFHEWIESEKYGMFGSMKEQCSEQLQGHRSDETMMALLLYKYGSKPFTGATRYNWAEGGIIQKMHFK